MSDAPDGTSGTEESPPGPPLGDRSAAPASRQQVRSDRRNRSSRRRKRIVLIVACCVVGVLVLLVGAAAGFLWYENHRIHRVAVKHLSAVQTSGSQRDVQNILLIGSTTRCGLKQQNPAFGLCDEGVTGVNSDVVMILHLDPDHDRASILSIPRDTFVPNAREDGVNKIDAALGDPAGPSQLIAAITDDFGIPIQHYVELNFDSFQSVVSALGGVKMYFPMPLYDAESSLNIPKAGCIDLNGFQALAVVRARHLQYEPSQDAGEPNYDWPYDPQSDLSRIRRDHEFLRVLASAVAHRGLGNFVTDLELIDSVAGSLEVDNGFSASDMAHLVLEFHHLSPYSIPQYTLPIVEDGQEYYYQGGDYGDVVFPVQPQDSQVVAKFLGVSDTRDSAGHALPAVGSFTVAVENGSGLYDQGEKTAQALEALGYDVTSVTDTDVSASTTEASVLYSNPADRDDALAVQSALSGLAVIGYAPGLVESPSSGSSPGGSSSSGGSSSGASSTTSTTIDVGTPLPSSQGADVVLVTGSNFSVNAPASSSNNKTTTTTGPTTTTTSGSAVSSTTTTTLGALAGNPNLAAPSSSTTTLEPWDPRSCTASGGEGP